MKKLLLYTSLLCFFLLSGCNKGTSPEEQKANLEKKVMEVHDSAMAKMNSIYHLRRDLRALRDTLEAQQIDTTALAPIKADIGHLNGADEAMMNWMRQYKAPVNLTHEQAMHYLQNELVKIERVQTLMDSTISAAQKTYEHYKQGDSL